jgi:hypothetical protein
VALRRAILAEELDISKILLSNLLHLQLFEHRLEKLVDLGTPELIKRAYVPGCRVLPVCRILASSFPIYDPNDVVSRC